MRRARSTDCTISSWQAVNKFAIGIPPPNIDRAVAETEFFQLARLASCASSASSLEEAERTFIAEIEFHKSKFDLKNPDRGTVAHSHRRTRAAYTAAARPTKFKRRQAWSPAQSGWRGLPARPVVAIGTYQ